MMPPSATPLRKSMLPLKTIVLAKDRKTTNAGKAVINGIQFGQPVIVSIRQDPPGGLSPSKIPTAIDSPRPTIANISKFPAKLAPIDIKSPITVMSGVQPVVARSFHAELLKPVRVTTVSSVKTSVESQAEQVATVQNDIQGIPVISGVHSGRPVIDRVSLGTKPSEASRKFLNLKTAPTEISDDDLSIASTSFTETPPRKIKTEKRPHVHPTNLKTSGSSSDAQSMPFFSRMDMDVVDDVYFNKLLEMLGHGLTNRYIFQKIPHETCPLCGYGENGIIDKVAHVYKKA